MAAYRHAERFRTETNSVAHAAAYQRAQALGNDGNVFDYRRKIGVAWTGIIAPACTPKVLLDAQTLWNTVERIESRKNARLAREMIIALPHQVDLDIHIAMLRAFITSHLTSRGMIADVAIHKPPVEHGGDPRNWHAHVLLTDRPITAAGFAASIARADNDAHLEARQIAVLHDTLQLDGNSLKELQAGYRRPHNASRIGRLKDLAFDGDVTRHALAISREQGHPWHHNSHRHGAPSLLDLLKPMVERTGPGHPMFTITAKDLAFCFYSLGFIGKRELQTSLENIALEEQRLFAERIAQKPQLRPPPPLTKPKPPQFPTPHADRLMRLQRAAVVPQNIYMKRLAQLNAYTARHQATAQRRRLGRTLPGRCRQMTPPLNSG